MGHLVPEISLSAPLEPRRTPEPWAARNQRAGASNGSGSSFVCPSRSVRGDQDLFAGIRLAARQQFLLQIDLALRGRNHQPVAACASPDLRQEVFAAHKVEDQLAARISRS